MKIQRSWYLVLSKPQQEKVALAHLERQGYSVYLPLLRQVRRRRSRRCVVIEPMFPRYLFVHLSSEVDDWGPIRSTRGVMRLIRFGNTPAEVPDDFVAELKCRETSDGVHELPDPQYKPGDSVRISSGSLAGYEAVFAARTGKERVLLLLHIAGKEARVQLPVDRIEPIGT